MTPLCYWCDAGLKIANRLQTHGSACTLVTANLSALVGRKIFATRKSSPDRSTCLHRNLYAS